MRLQTLIFVPVLILAFSTQINAQTTFGIKSGINISNFAGDSFVESDSRLGFHIGVLTNYEISERFGVQAEVQYSQQGFTRELETDAFNPSDFDPTISSSTVDSSFRLDFINVPLTFQYNIVEKFSVHLGPQFGFAIGESFKVDGDKVDIEGSDYATVEVGLAGGLGYNFESGVFVQARYIYGLTDINPDDVETLNNDDVLNRNLQLSVGFIFN